MASLVDQEFQHELCEFGPYHHKVADVDDDGKPRRTGISQPVFGALETWASLVWPDSKFVTIEHSIRIGKYINFRGHLLRLTWRTVYVVVVTVLAMAFPFFNDVLALLGAVGYWPMTVYFPVEMYIAQKKIQRGSVKWFVLQLLSLLCLLVAIAAACGAIEGLNHALQNSKPFKF